MAHKLGDWKTSVSIGVAYQVFCKHDCNFARYGFLKYQSRVCVCVCVCVYVCVCARARAHLVYVCMCIYVIAPMGKSKEKLFKK